MRHDISINVKERIYQAAFVVLVVFFAFIIFNDVTKLPHLHPPQAVVQVISGQLSGRSPKTSGVSADSETDPLINCS